MTIILALQFDYSLTHIISPFIMATPDPLHIPLHIPTITRKGNTSLKKSKTNCNYNPRWLTFSNSPSALLSGYKWGLLDRWGMSSLYPVGDAPAGRGELLTDQGQGGNEQLGPCASSVCGPGHKSASWAAIKRPCYTLHLGSNKLLSWCK